MAEIGSTSIEFIEWINNHMHTINSFQPSDSNMVMDIWVNIGSGKGLLPDGTEPLFDPALT